MYVIVAFFVIHRVNLYFTESVCSSDDNPTSTDIDVASFAFTPFERAANHIRTSKDSNGSIENINKKTFGKSKRIAFTKTKIDTKREENPIPVVDDSFPERDQNPNSLNKTHTEIPMKIIDVKMKHHKTKRKKVYREGRRNIYTCTTCNDVFQYRILYYRHMKTIHGQLKGLFLT